MNTIAKRFHFLEAEDNQEWAQRVINEDERLRPGERDRLRIALMYPDLFAQAPYDHILYKVLRRSKNDFARDLAVDLRHNVSRFNRFERFWQAREARPVRRQVLPRTVLSGLRAEDSGMVRMVTPKPPFYRQAALRPTPAVAMSVLISALTMAG